MTTDRADRLQSIAAMVRARAEAENLAYIFHDRHWTWREAAAEAAARAAWLNTTVDRARPPHVGVLMGNTPDHAFLLLGAALAGVTVAGINSTRRGAELIRDVEHSQCQFVVADNEHAGLLPAALLAEDEPWRDHAGAPMPPVDPDPRTPLTLIFTSGSTSAPKAVVRSQGAVAKGAYLGFTPDDVLYCVMPMFHGTALYGNFFPGLAGGSCVVLREKFSASTWLDDVRRYGVTFTNSVGRALSYILATPPTEFDRDHKLKVVLAGEASPRDAAEFEKRFGVKVLSGYGSSEYGIVLLPVTSKPGSLGKPPRDADIAVVDRDTRAERPRARFDASGRLLNGEEAIGELVRRDADTAFEGYWNNPEAEAERVRDGWFWSGDLAYRDEDGVFWFAGRVGEWVRVDSENFALGPVERILARFPDAAAVAVVGVPDPLAGDQLLVGMEMKPGVAFDPSAFAGFLAEQSDLGTKWAPRFVRICDPLPSTGNGKVNKQPLKRQAWLTTDPVWWRPARANEYRELTDADRDALAADFARHGRPHEHPGS